MAALPFMTGLTTLLGEKQQKREARILEAFLREIEMRPDPYYILLVADGDAMGKAIDAQARRPDGLCAVWPEPSRG